MKSLKRQRDDAQASLCDYVRSLGKEPAIVGFKGFAIAVLVAIADFETVSLIHNPKFQEIIEQSRKQQQAGGGSGRTQKKTRLRMFVVRTRVLIFRASKDLSPHYELVRCN